MEPKKRTIFIEVEYWDCGNDAHRHKTKEVAKKCIARNANKTPLPPKEVNYKRYIHAAKAAINGATFKEAGEDIGVCSGRAQQIMRKILRMSLHPSRNPGTPPCSHYDVRDIRQHKKYWLDRVDVIAKHWGV